LRKRERRREGDISRKKRSDLRRKLKKKYRWRELEDLKRAAFEQKRRGILPAGGSETNKGTI